MLTIGLIGAVFRRQRATLWPWKELHKGWETGGGYQP